MHLGSHAREERGGAKMDKSRYIFISGSRVRSQIMRKATVKIERELKSRKVAKGRKREKERKKVVGTCVKMYGPLIIGWMFRPWSSI